MLLEQELPQALGQEHPDEHDVCAGSSCPGCPPVLSPLDSCSGLLETDSTIVPFSEDALPQESERISGSSGAEAASVLACDRCGLVGHHGEQCPSYRLPPLRHPDATSRGACPHMRQADYDAILASTVRGQATKARNNCLIDALRQLVQPTAKVAQIRRALQLEFPTGARKVTAGNYLQFDFHAAAVLRHMGFDPTLFTLTCLDLAHSGHGDVLGHGARKLFLAREGQNHFLPLFHRAARR